jgi:hypothetical protein
MHHKWSYAPHPWLPPSASDVIADYPTNRQPHGSVVSEASADTCPFHNTLSPNTILPNIDQLIRSFSKRNSLMGKTMRHHHKGPATPPPGYPDPSPTTITHSALTQIAINELFLCPPVPAKRWKLPHLGRTCAVTLQEITFRDKQHHPMPIHALHHIAATNSITILQSTRTLALA